MKETITLFLAIILISCNQRIDKDTRQFKSPEKNSKEIINDSESYRTVVTDQINQQLSETSRNLTATEVMKLFYPHSVEISEGNETIEICEKRGKDDHTVITLIHDNLLDDSQKAVKYVMELNRTNNRWTVISIKMNWKCWPERGHTDWGTNRCI